MKPRDLRQCGSPPSHHYAAGHPLAFALSLPQQLASVPGWPRKGSLGSDHQAEAPRPGVTLSTGLPAHQGTLPGPLL